METWTKQEREKFLAKCADVHSDDRTVVEFCDKVARGGPVVRAPKGWKRSGSRGRKLGPHEVHK